MLAQDTLTGALYDVPEFSGFGAYDGLGFDFGNLLKTVLPGVGNIVSGLIGGGGGGGAAPALPGLPNIAGLLGGGGGLPGLSNIFGGLFGGGAPGAPGGLPIPIPPLPGLPGFPGFPSPSNIIARLFGGGGPAPAPHPMMPFRPPMPFHRSPMPVGWVTPALPYTGTAPRRLYMRCSVWPGQAGLVPAFAAQTPAGAPGAPVPGALPAVPVVPGIFGRRHPRGHRRRR